MTLLGQGGLRTDVARTLNIGGSTTTTAIFTVVVDKKRA